MGFGKKKSAAAAPAAATPAPVATVPTNPEITRAGADASQATANAVANLQSRSDENKSATLLQTKEDEELKKRQEAMVGVA